MQIEIKINGEPKEIADLAIELRSQHNGASNITKAKVQKCFEEALENTFNDITC